MNRFVTVWVGLLSLLCIAILLAMSFNQWPGIPVRNNIMHLLPSLSNDPVLLQALERSNNLMSRKLLILSGHKDPGTARTIAQAVKKNLSAQDFFSEPLTGLTSAQTEAIGKMYYQSRVGLLSESQRTLIRLNNTASLEQQLTQTVFSPVSGVNATLLANDPLLNFYFFLRDLPTTQGHIKNENGNLIVHKDGVEYYVLLVDIQHDVFDMGFHPAYEQWRQNLHAQLDKDFPGNDVLFMGAVQHAVWGASSAKREVSTIGNGSLLGIIILMLLVFRGVRVLLASLLPLGIGVFAGLVLTLLCDGEIHMITLVFGSSVIGVAMDYSLHYLAEHYKNSETIGHDRQCILKQVFPGITLAMLTSAIAYAAIGIAPFPILRQIALFSVAGLFTAWLTVVTLYPLIIPTAHYRHTLWLDLSDALDRFLRRLFDHRSSRWIIAALMMAMVPGLLSLHANDDLRLLQTPEPGISAMESRVQTLTGFQPSGRFFLVEGDTQEELLQRTEQLTAWLTSQKITADSLTHFIPSQKTQLDNFTAMQHLIEDDAASNASLLARWQSTLGLPSDVMDRYRASFSQPPDTWLTPDAFTETALQSQLQRFQLMPTERGWISSVFVQGAPDFSALRLRATQQPGVHWMDTVSDISDLFRHYREQSAVMMLAAYTLIALLLGWRYGWRGGLRVLLAPALAAWMTLGLIGYADIPVNLFHVLALLLVLGVGIDYSIFFAESASHRDSTMLAVLLSTITTLLSFGLLSLSQTAAISSFGIVVSIGMVCSLLFSPLAQHHSHAEKRVNHKTS